jgi:GDP-4-dehydro-6-deoxy-D-mannose reductase
MAARRGGVNGVRVLVTGIGGFVGLYLARHLLEEGAEVAGVVHGAGDAERLALLGAQVTLVEGDVLDPDGTEVALRRLRPDAIFHLAGFASAGRSFVRPLRCMEVNALGTGALLWAVHRSGLRPRVLVVSSSEVYGGGSAPISEEAPLHPRSPYAASKAASEMAARAAVASWEIPCVIARSFNHLGPGQDPRFVTPSLAQQIAAAERRGETCVLEVGDLRPVRDFSRVEDVVRAYRLLLERGVPGEAYNVGSGRGAPVRAVLDALVAAARVGVAVRVNEARLRPGEPEALVADTRKLEAAIGFTPRPALPEAAGAVLEEQRRLLTAAG